MINKLYILLGIAIAVSITIVITLNIREAYMLTPSKPLLTIEEGRVVYINLNQKTIDFMVSR